MNGVFALQERSVIHFNVADFAVAVEQICDRSLAGRPLIIAPLRTSRAVVFDMSEEAYREGVRKGMLLRDATRSCRAATLLQPRVDLYQKAMQSFLQELRSYSPRIEYGTADGHFFIDVTGTHRLHGPPPDVGLRVRRHVRQTLGINPIWTLGTSKLIAKVASRLVKPVGEYIVGPGEEEQFLAPLAVDLLPGVTGRELDILGEFQLNTIGAIARLSAEQLMIPFGGRSDFFYAVCRGVDTHPVGSEQRVGDSVEYEYTFTPDTNDRDEVDAVLTYLAGMAGSALRESRREAKRIGIWLRYSDGGHIVRQAVSRTGTASDSALYQLAQLGLERAWIRRTRLRGCRLVCDRLQKKSPQLALFPEPARHNLRQRQLNEAIDRVRGRFGQACIGPGRGQRMLSQVENGTLPIVH